MPGVNSALRTRLFEFPATLIIRASPPIPITPISLQCGRHTLAPPYPPPPRAPVNNIARAGCGVFAISRDPWIMDLQIRAKERSRHVAEDYVPEKQAENGKNGKVRVSRSLRASMCA
jgi:hypothetical protein